LQWKAFILSLCILLYGAECTMTPRIVVASCMTPKTATPQTTHSCCHKEDTCPKPSKGCNTPNDCCLNCPLCYVTVLAIPADNIETQSQPREYSLWVSSYVYLYHASCWKPPNAA